jgi:hypothetical protein
MPYAAVTWTFAAVASVVGGVTQLIGWRVHRGELRSALVLPWRLWAVSLPCFVGYGLVWPLALATADKTQVYGVNYH